jgi:hypothetical protein
LRFYTSSNGLLQVSSLTECRMAKICAARNAAFFDGYSQERYDSGLAKYFKEFELNRIQLHVFFTTIFLAVTALTPAHAVPIDWHGEFGIDSTLIDSYRRIEATSVGSTGTGTQEVDLASGGHANASFQTYLFKLNPVIVVNDSATIKGEITTNYGRGGRLGDESTYNSEGSYANALYFYNTSGYSNELNINQIYSELYSDTATYVLGRHSDHWGLGAVINNGESIWSRHVYIRDGATARFKIGNFEVNPFMGKIGSSSSFTRATKLKEHGFSLLYNNLDRDLSFGIFYAKRENSTFNTSATSNINNTGSTSLGKSDAKLTDLYLKKGWGKYSLGVEVPIMSGEIGQLYSSGVTTKLKTKAFIVENKYLLTDSWVLGFDAGDVSGDSGGQSSFEAMYLNPNYQFANLMFRFNNRAISGTNTNVSIFDSYVTNVRYFKLYAIYSSSKTEWKPALIWAKAKEVAIANTSAFNHERNRLFTAVADQSDDLGMEVDLDFTYNWSQEVKLGISSGYHFVGDYYAFTNNNSVVNSAKNSFVIQFKSDIRF